MANIFQTVQTYQKASMGRLLNQMVHVELANKKFNEFNKTFAPNNLGNTVTFDKPPRMYSNNTLVVDSFDGLEQRVETLSVTSKGNVNWAVDNEDYIFNLEPNDYMKEFGTSAMVELGNKVETDIANVWINSPYRFYGDGTTPISSIKQLVLANQYFRNFGAPAGDFDVVLDDLSVPEIVNTMLNQFSLKRNDELANSWELGSYNQANYFSSNQLPTHTAGTLGNDGTVLTVVSTNDPTGAAITEITFSGAGSDADAVFENDLGYFIDNVSGQPNLRYLTFTGHSVSKNPVQVRVTADSASSAGNVTVSVYPTLSVTPGRNQNLNTNIVAGMQFKLLPTHRRGGIIAGKGFYTAIPKLPNQSPYPTSNQMDEKSRVAMRMTYGAIFGKAEQGMIYDVIWGYKGVPEYLQALIFPA